MKNPKNLLTIEVGSGENYSLYLENRKATVHEEKSLPLVKEALLNEEVTVIRGSITVSP
ncbi:MAG: hypothetical protein ACKVOH_00945 [Chlamydiales bacterium]